MTMAALTPFTYLCTSVVLGAIAVKNPREDNLGLLGLSTSLALLAFREVADVTSWAELSSLLSFFVLLWISHIVKLLVLDKSTPPTWRMAYRTLLDFRGVSAKKQNLGVSYETPDIRVNVLGEKEESRRSDSSFKDSERRTFLMKRLTSAVTIMFLNHAYTTSYPLLLHLSYADFHPSKQIYLRRIRIVTARETALRSWLVFHFVWSSYSIFTATHDLLAFAHVAIGIDEPEDWPRLYGSVFEAYTMRRFWGKFWHRLVQRSYVAHGSVISRKILRLPPGCVADRICVSVFVFLTSGVVHACITVQHGFKCGYWEDLGFFMMSYAALLGEEGVQRATSQAFGTTWQKGWTCRVLGYTWVFGFLFWVLPKHQYAKVLCAPT
ncbi:membrane bound O-acyl transferase family-domain-containing protein [Usnea florida]